MRAEDPEDVLQNIDDHIGRFKECESDFGRIGFPRLNSALSTGTGGLLLGCGFGAGIDLVLLF